MKIVFVCGPYRETMAAPSVSKNIANATDVAVKLWLHAMGRHIQNHEQQVNIEALPHTEPTDLDAILRGLK